MEARNCNLESKNIDSLNKNVSNNDFDSPLLHATSCLKVNEKTGQETFSAKTFDITLQALGMSVIVQSEQIYDGNKRPWVKTIVIQSVENDRRNDQWDYDSSCHRTKSQTVPY